MSDSLKHECGVVLLRLKKHTAYYHEVYNDPAWGIHVMHSLMKKLQHRGQDGVGISSLKLNAPIGHRFIARYRSNPSKNHTIDYIFNKIYDKTGDLIKKHIKERKNKGRMSKADYKTSAQYLQYLEEYVPFYSELHLGHVRYGTYGVNNKETVHPFLRQSNWKSRNLMIAGNFNMTNTDLQFDKLIHHYGQHPKEQSDTVTLLEQLGALLDHKVKETYFEIKEKQGNEFQNNEFVSEQIASRLDITDTLRECFSHWDGGFVICGIIGSGTSFVVRDRMGIRPAYYYHDDEAVVVASEKEAILTTFAHSSEDAIVELPAGHVILIDRDGNHDVKPLLPLVAKGDLRKCAFERIYFSSGLDKDVYAERKALGMQLTNKVIEHCQDRIDNTVFSFIPRTSEPSFYGLVAGLNDWLNKHRRHACEDTIISEKERNNWFKRQIRTEKVLEKQRKERTFIKDNSARTQSVLGAYSIVQNSVSVGQDHLVLVDDSIVRGTTLITELIPVVCQYLQPLSITIVSSSPIIKYLDFYGINLSTLNELLAFRSLKKIILGDEDKLQQAQEIIHHLCSYHCEREKLNSNALQKLYDLTPDNELVEGMEAELHNETRRVLKAKKINMYIPPIRLIYQDIEGLRKACPNHLGHWYFNGEYPTPGGHYLINKRLYEIRDVFTTPTFAFS